jgi:hypothetical protein
MKLDMFNNDEYLSSVEGNITYHNSGHAEFTDYATGDHHAFNWDLSDNNLILVNGATGIEIVYQIESFSKTAAFLSCDNSIKLRLVRI